MTILDLIPSAGSFKHVAATSGGEWAGPCPECGGVDRFLIWPHHPRGVGKGGRFMCRGCGKQGDGIQYLIDFHGMGYREACKVFLVMPRERRKFHPSRVSKAVWTPKPSTLPGDLWQAAAIRFARGCMAELDKSPEGQAYVRSRGLTLATCRRLGIGWNTVNRFDSLQAWGLSEEADLETGKPRRLWLPAGLVIPTTAENRTITSLKIRRSGWQETDRFPKYVAVKGGVPSPYTLDAMPGKPVVVVESELDAALISQEAGDLVAAMALGTAKGKPDQTATAFLRAAPGVLVSLDYDEAGKAAWPWWKETFPSALPCPVPKGKDVGDIVAIPGLVRAWIEWGIRHASPETERPSPRP